MKLSIWWPTYGNSIRMSWASSRMGMSYSRTLPYLRVSKVCLMPPGCPICSRAVLTVPHFLIHCIDLENTRRQNFENVNNLTLKSLFGDSAPIDKRVVYDPISEKHWSVWWNLNCQRECCCYLCHVVGEFVWLFLWFGEPVSELQSEHMSESSVCAEGVRICLRLVTLVEKRNFPKDGSVTGSYCSLEGGWMMFHFRLFKSILFFVNWNSLCFFHHLYNTNMLCLLLLYLIGV